MPTIQGPRRLLLTPASEIAPQRAKWLWAQRIAVGTLAILAGREGVGKSTLAYWIAAQVTRGLLPGEMLGTRAAVLVCATEDSWAHTIVPRLMAAEADLRLVFRVEVATSEGVGELVLPVDVDEVAAAAQSVGAALLLLDPLMSRLSASLDTHRDAEVRQALEPLTKVLAENDLSALGLMHFNKSGGDDPLNSLMASRAFGAVARSVSTVVKDPDDEADRRRFFGTPKNNLGPDGLPLLAFTVEPVVIPTADGDTAIGRVVWGDEVEESITEVLRRTLNGGDRTVTQEAAEWLADYLTQQGGQEESAKIKKAGHAAGHNEQALQRARKRLRLVTTSSGFPRRTFWEFGHDSHDMASHDTLGKTVITDMTDMTEASRASHVSHASRVGPPEGDMTGLTCRSCGEPMSFDVEGDGVHPTCPRPTGA